MSYIVMLPLLHSMLASLELSAETLVPYFTKLGFAAKLNTRPNVTFCSFPSVDPNDQKKTACYDIDVEVDDTLKTQMNSFLLSTASQQEIAGLDNKVCTVDPPAKQEFCIDRMSFLFN